jgi:hypothetical protein
VLVVIPPTVSMTGLVHSIPDKLLDMIRRHNRVSCEDARIQVRVAIHIGPIQHDGYGFVGCDVNYLHRMLNAPALKRKLAISGAEIALITSEYLYDNIVVRRPSLIDPATFKSLTVRVKETRTRAWAYTLGAPTEGAAVVRTAPRKLSRVRPAGLCLGEDGGHRRITAGVTAEPAAHTVPEPVRGRIGGVFVIAAISGVRQTGTRANSNDRLVRRRAVPRRHRPA